MARRRSSRSKMEPMVTTLRFENQNIVKSGSQTFYIDLMQCASLLNRKFLRQGLNVAVSGIRILSSTGDPLSRAEGYIVVSKVPTSWVFCNAWVKSMNVWRDMIDEATEDSGADSIKGRFLDFKVFADAGHHQAGVGANLLPMSGNAVVAAPGQWQMSEIVIPETYPAAGDAGETTTYELLCVGPNDPGASPASGHNAKSIVQGYADSRGLPSPEDPNVPAGASQNWMMRLFAEGTQQDEVVTNMLEVTGDNPPYPFEGDQAGTPDTMYPGGETQLPGLAYHSLDYITSSTIGGVSYVKGGQFPCGLIRLDIGNTNEDSNMEVAIEVELIPGPHRGLLCLPMQDVN